MDDESTELYAFIDGLGVPVSLGEPQEKGMDAVQPLDPDNSTEADVDAAESDVWKTIADAIDTWSQRILDAESLHDRSESYRRLVDNSLRRLEVDGFVSPIELGELRTTLDTAVRLLHALSSYFICSNPSAQVKQDIISLMLDLYNLNLLNTQTFIYCCANL